MLSEPDGSRLLEIARHSLEAFVRRRERWRPDLSQLPENLLRPGCSFVTLRHLTGDLRGCLGNTEAREPLAWDVARNAATSASRDPRFDPVAEWELAGLRLEVSVLTPPQPLLFDNYDHLLSLLRPGTDGVILSWQGRRGLLLPQVWARVSNPADFLQQICLKANLPGRELQQTPPTITAQTFQVQYFAEAGYIEL